jgi:hypothetical protein
MNAQDQNLYDPEPQRDDGSLDAEERGAFNMVPSAISRPVAYRLQPGQDRCERFGVAAHRIRDRGNVVQVNYRQVGVQNR